MKFIAQTKDHNEHCQCCGATTRKGVARIDHVDDPPIYGEVYCPKCIRALAKALDRRTTHPTGGK